MYYEAASYSQKHNITDIFNLTLNRTTVVVIFFMTFNNCGKYIHIFSIQLILHCL